MSKRNIKYFKWYFHNQNICSVYVMTGKENKPFIIHCPKVFNTYLVCRFGKRHWFSFPIKFSYHDWHFQSREDVWATFRPKLISLELHPLLTECWQYEEVLIAFKQNYLSKTTDLHTYLSSGLSGCMYTKISSCKVHT